jgi:hypothetical protein
VVAMGAVEYFLLIFGLLVVVPLSSVFALYIKKLITKGEVNWEKEIKWILIVVCPASVLIIILLIISDFSG